MVSSNISSPSLSENRWNQIKTLGKEGNTFESYGLTGLGLSQTSYNVAGAMFDICAAILVCSRRAHMSWPTWPNILQTDWDLRDLVPFEGRPESDQSATNSLAIPLFSWQSKALKSTWNRKFIRPIGDISLFLSYCILLPCRENVRKQTKCVCNQTEGNCHQRKANNWCFLLLVGNTWNVRWMRQLCVCMSIDLIVPSSQRWYWDLVCKKTAVTFHLQKAGWVS